MMTATPATQISDPMTSQRSGRITKYPTYPGIGVGTAANFHPSIAAWYRDPSTGGLRTPPRRLLKI